MTTNVMVFCRFELGGKKRVQKRAGNPTSLNLIPSSNSHMFSSQKQGIDAMNKARRQVTVMGDVTGCGHAGPQKLGPLAPIGDRRLTTPRVSHLQPELVVPRVHGCPARHLFIPWISRDHLHGHSRQPLDQQTPSTRPPSNARQLVQTIERTN